jgi:hypothetical protein
MKTKSIILLIKEGAHYYMTEKYKEALVLLDSLRNSPQVINDPIKFWRKIGSNPQMYIDVFEVLPFISNSKIGINRGALVNFKGM